MSSNLHTSAKDKSTEWTESSRYFTRKRGKQQQFSSLTNTNNKMNPVYTTDLNAKMSSVTTKIPALNTPKRGQTNQIKNSLQFLRNKVSGKPHPLLN